LLNNLLLQIIVVDLQCHKAITQLTLNLDGNMKLTVNNIEKEIAKVAEEFCHLACSDTAGNWR